MIVTNFLIFFLLFFFERMILPILCYIQKFFKSLNQFFEATSRVNIVILYLFWLIEPKFTIVHKFENCSLRGNYIRWYFWIYYIGIESTRDFK